MKSLWGEVGVADAHLHFFSHRFFALLAAQKGPAETPATVCATLGWPTPPESPRELAATWVAELDRHGVGRSVLIASLPGDEDSVAEAVAAFPERFIGYFLVNPLAPDALSRTQAAFARGLRGLVLFPAMHRFSIAGEEVAPLLALAAAQPRAMVFVHCGVLSVGVRARLGLPSPFDLRYSSPIDLHPAALRHPNLAFTIPHFGAGYFREALMVCDLCPNVYLDTSSTNSWRRYQPGMPDLATVFRQALGVVGPRRLLFGSDSSFFPRGWHRGIFDQQCEALAAANVQGEEAAMILGGNLLRLVG